MPRERFIDSFPDTLDAARQVQDELRARVVLDDAFPDRTAIRLVGGADVAFVSGKDPSGEPVTHAIAGIVVMDRATREVVETSLAVVIVRMPYIPGYLSFREGPAVLAALEKLATLPDVMLYDGNGIAHPRAIGLASHLAVLTGIPSVGSAKSLLCGHCGDPGVERGYWTPLTYRGQIVGSCLRTRTGVKPVYVSPGSGFTVDSARELVLDLAGPFRNPEPLRLAHRLVTAARTSEPVLADIGYSLHSEMVD